VKNTSAKLIFERMASTNNDTLTSYLSLLMTSGLDTWDNRAIDAASATSDFSFRDIRRRPHAIYLVVESEMIRPLAPLIRLFFSDLIDSLQAKEPGDDEPWPVMIMLDEFDRLGKMPIVAESIKTLRSFGGNLAIVTQTIPALDEIYGENTRRSLQGGAGVKLYLTPSEQKTIEELSQAVGKTTKRVVTRSRAVGRNPFEGRSVSERTEDTPLLTEDQARRMDLDEVILVIDAQMPIRARRVKYFEDPALKVLHAGQVGSFPYPDEEGLRRDRQMTETRETVERLKQELQEVRAAAGAKEAGITAASIAVETPTTAKTASRAPLSRRARGRAARAAVGGGMSGHLSVDLARLGLDEADRTELAEAVQTTRAIIAEYW
jgi:type IV secretion system protein VirD4